MMDRPKAFRRKLHRDLRGSFSEFVRDSGPLLKIAQVNVVQSHRGVTRGLHVSLHPGSAKLVGVVSGKVFDVAVDLRHDSPEYGRVYMFELSADRMVFIPRGFGHGMQSLRKSLLVYCTDKQYEAHVERTVQWNDPALKIDWPMKKPILSEHDQQGMSFEQWGKLHEDAVRFAAP